VVYSWFHNDFLPTFQLPCLKLEELVLNKEVTGPSEAHRLLNEHHESLNQHRKRRLTLAQSGVFFKVGMSAQYGGVESDVGVGLRVEV
jgi:hypothetical protein